MSQWDRLPISLSTTQTPRCHWAVWALHHCLTTWQFSIRKLLSLVIGWLFSDEKFSHTKLNLSIHSPYKSTDRWHICAVSVRFLRVWLIRYYSSWTLFSTWFGYNQRHLPMVARLVGLVQTQRSDWVIQPKNTLSNAKWWMDIFWVLYLAQKKFDGQWPLTLWLYHIR